MNILKEFKFTAFAVIIVVAIIGTIGFAALIDKASGPEIYYSGEIDGLQFSDGRAIMQLPDSGILIVPLLGDKVYNIDFKPGGRYEVWIYPANNRLVKIVPLVGDVKS